MWVKEEIKREIRCHFKLNDIMHITECIDASSGFREKFISLSAYIRNDGKYNQ